MKMARMSDQKLSLVAQFDDIVRNCSVLTAGIEEEFMQFAENQELCRLRWLEAEQGGRGTKRKIQDLEKENQALETKLKHARTQIDHEMRRRVKTEQDKESLERQIAIVRELLTDRCHGHQTLLNETDLQRLPFLTSQQPISHSPQRPGGMPTIEESQSLLSPSDISYDKTEEDLDTSYLRNGKPWKVLPTAPALEDVVEERTPAVKESSGKKKKSPNKRKHRRSRSAAAVVTTTLTVDGNEVEATSHVTSSKHETKKKDKKMMKKHHSARNVRDAVDSDDSYVDTMNDRNRQQWTPGNDGDATTPTNNSPGMRHYNSAGRSLNRPHNFVTKNILTLEKCHTCDRRFGFAEDGLKCKGCKVLTHVRCKDSVPLPCCPNKLTPGTGRNIEGVIADYAPSEAPKIPALLIHCVNEVESRGLKQEGIYRVPGVEREVRDLRDRFLRGRAIPNLSHIQDINVVCGCLKDFLRNLKEPLVTFKQWKGFLKAAEMKDQEESISATYQAISQLPQANRDTIAFLILHLQRVAECPEVRMSLTSLARVFGPTMIGHSCSKPEPLQTISETPKQQRVMERFLTLPSDYWITFINIEDAMYQAGGQTPQTPDVPASMLGPISTPGTTPRTSRSGFPSWGSRGNRNATNFFASPVV